MSSSKQNVQSNKCFAVDVIWYLNNNHTFCDLPPKTRLNMMSELKHDIREGLCDAHRKQVEKEASG